MVSPIQAKEDVTVRLLSAFKNLISEGALTPGSRLPAERDLAETFQVSRSSLRQALKALEIMGVVSQRVGDGTYVNLSPALLGEPMEFLILLNGISFNELMDARLIVEPELAARAADRASREDLSALRIEMEAMEQSEKSHPAFIRHDLEFHKAIFRMAGNRVCSMLFSVVHQSLHDLMAVTSRLVPAEHTLNLHHRIYIAIRRRDPEEARRRMAEHLQDARGLLGRANDQQKAEHLQNRLTQLGAPARKGFRKKG